MKTRRALAVAVLALSPWAPALQNAIAAVRVDYDPPALSVDATDADLIEVLNAIGAKVGFTVSQSRALSTPVSISVEKAPVEDVLRRLLRSENHTILYRQGSDAAVEVDRIVLLGPPGEGGPAPESAIARAPAVLPVQGVERGPTPGALAPPIAVGDAPRTPTPTTGSPAPAIDSSAPAAGSEEAVTVGDMLRSHALAGVPPQASPEAAEAPRLPASLEETLAITTRRAQQGLTSLVEGLEKATQALQQQQTAAPTPGR